MTIQEIRHDLTLKGFVQELGGITRPTEFSLYQSKVNLTPGHAFTVQAVDVVQNGFEVSNPDGTKVQVKRDIFASIYPVIIDNNPAHEGAEDTVSLANVGRKDIIYRKTDVLEVENEDLYTISFSEQFPRNELAGFPTMTFFTPQIYITVIYQVITTDSNPDAEVNIISPDFTLYMGYEHRKVDEITLLLGQIAEFSEAQLIAREITGLEYATYGPSTWGDFFPLWQMGGKRAQLTTNRYGLLNQSVDEGETAVPLATLQGVYQRAITAVPWNEPFGQATLGSDDIPDWLKEIVTDTLGVMSGPLLQRRIPHRRDDNGDLRVF